MKNHSSAFARKFKKLTRDPRKFFADSKRLTPLARLFDNHATASERSEQLQMEEVTTEVAVPGLEAFDTIGNAWLNNEPERKIAVLWGFNPWKRGFVSRYLEDYRCAFARGRTPWAIQKVALDQYENLEFFCWGMNAPTEVTEYAGQRNIPCHFMEDGFIRSTRLGSEHSLPLSLAWDSGTAYFDANISSNLEDLLNTYDFAQDRRMLASADPLMRLFCGFGISKYNLGSYQPAARVLGVKLKRRVLVVGQVEDDASIRYGLAESWTCTRLIELAVQENPGAEIIYRPHPDVVQGFRSNTAELQELRKVCRVLTDDVMLADLFRQVDHVYVITSLSGMEALLHGKPVTVVGMPFYAGWGLTDDRQHCARRSRKLSLAELFCGVYLLYPKYLANMDEPVTGYLATIVRLAAERRQQLNAGLSAKVVDRRVALLAQSDFWPVLFRPDQLPRLETKFAKKLLSAISIPYIFSQCQGAHYHRAMVYFVVGKLAKSVVLAKVLGEIRARVKPDIFGELLERLWECQPSPLLLDQWAVHAELCGRRKEAVEAREHLSFSGESYVAEPQKEPLNPKRFGYTLRLAQLELSSKNLGRAEALFNRLVLAGFVQPDVFVGLAEIARLRFDFASSAAILRCLNYYDPNWKLGRGHLLQAQAESLARNPLAALESLAVACAINPQYVESVGSVADVLDREVGELPYAAAMLAAVEVVEVDSELGRVKGLIAQERPAEAEQLLLSYSPKPAEVVKYCLLLSQAYSYQGKLSAAKELVGNALRDYPTLLLYREGLRLAVLSNDYGWGELLLAEAIERNIEVGDMYHRKMLLGLGDIKGSYLSFRDMRAHRVLKTYAEEKYVQALGELDDSSSACNVVLGCFGPGDEIRFASLYAKMSARCGDSRVRFTCDPRLLPLLQRHYTDLEFVPTARIRSLAWLNSYEKYNALPGSDLHTFFDNAGWEAVQGADKVTLTTDLLGDLIDGYESFEGAPYLKADPQQIELWHERLRAQASGCIRVGLSWRSSLTTYSRNEHYLSVEELAPLFELEGVQFVNLQYDDCTEELAWIEQRFPGRMINFPDLDQFNDLDGVAALMCCLDLVIAPATTVVELAGALGCPTLLLSNSSELHWRKKPGTFTDVWHGSITHVEGSVLGDKSSLCVAAKTAMDSFLAESLKSGDRQLEYS